MQVSKRIGCNAFPCVDVRHDRYLVPEIVIDPEDFSMVMISEAAPDDPADYYYAGNDPLFEQTTVQAFNQAGVDVGSIRDLLELGIYFTSAVKCGKTGYGIKADTVKECSTILEKELALFPNVQVFLLMGDVAIKAINYIAQRNGEPRAIPAGSTYKIRGGEFYFQGKRVFPSYLQVGPSFGIEKSKQRMIAEDIAAAMRLLE
jgi:uracil-DNA glycosylase